MSQPALTPDDYDPQLEVCPVCYGGPLVRYDADFRGHLIDRCRSCGTKVMNPQYSDDWLARFYAGYIGEGGTVQGHKCRPEVRRTGKMLSLRLFAEQLDEASESRRLLMVGCGDGMELGLARELGWQPEGYDISPEITKAISEKYGLPVHCGDFLSLAVPDGHFDAVFMDQVIEHVKNPGDYIRKIHSLLRPGGIAFFGQPNIGSLSNRLKTVTSRFKLRSRKRRGNHYASKHHIIYFTPRGMRGVLTAHGFEVLLTRASLKPAKYPWQKLYGGIAFFDSGFLAIARRPSNETVRSFRSGGERGRQVG